MDFRLLLPHRPQGIGADLADPHSKFKSDGPDPFSISWQMLHIPFLPAVAWRMVNALDCVFPVVFLIA